jgi:hypothetical protein
MKLRTLLAAALMACALAPVAQAQQVKYASIWEQPADNAALDDWYRRVHSKESIQFVGPWLSRYWAFRGYDVPPAETKPFNVIRYRLTEMWYASPADRAEGQKNWKPLTGPPTDLVNFAGKTQITSIWAPATPDELYKNDYPKAQPTYLRWVFFMRYPAGVSLEDGEAWFTKVHAPEMAKAPGVRRFVCAKSVDPITTDKAWVRMCEVWFDDYAGWKAMAITSPPKYTAPAWRKTFPFVDYASIFTAQKPDMDFLNDGYRAP